MYTRTLYRIEYSHSLIWAYRCLLANLWSMHAGMLHIATFKARTKAKERRKKTQNIHPTHPSKCSRPNYYPYYYYYYYPVEMLRFTINSKMPNSNYFTIHAIFPAQCSFHYINSFSFLVHSWTRYTIYSIGSARCIFAVVSIYFLLHSACMCVVKCCQHVLHMDRKKYIYVWTSFLMFTVAHSTVAAL